MTVLERHSSIKITVLQLLIANNYSKTTIYHTFYNGKTTLYTLSAQMNLDSKY